MMMVMLTPSVVQEEGGGGVDGTPLESFWYVAYFETILPSVKSLWSSRQNKVYFIGGGAAGDL